MLELDEQKYTSSLHQTFVDVLANNRDASKIERDFFIEGSNKIPFKEVNLTKLPDTVLDPFVSVSEKIVNKKSQMMGLLRLNMRKSKKLEKIVVVH